MKLKYIHREIETILLSAIKQFPSLAITGPRQSGKTTLLKRVFPDYKYISFDNILYRNQAIEDPELFLHQAGLQVIIDEIQYVPELLSYIKIIIDENRKKKGMFLFTGSQQFNLIKNLGDSLAGRIGLLNLLPFNFFEINYVNKSGKYFNNDLDQFIYSCLNSSYPEPVTDKNISIESWYSAYLQTYIERDVRSLYNVGNLRDFQRFMQILAANCSCLLNLSTISTEIGVSVNTVKRWISILEASNIIFLLPPYYNNFKKRIVKAPKIYFTDCGLVCFLTGINTADHLIKGPMSGKIFENYCIQETLKIYYNKGKRPLIYYIRTQSNLEIDLLIETSFQNIYPVEIKISKTLKTKMGENIERYIKLFPKLNINPGYLLSFSDENFQLTKNVQSIKLSNYLKWLNSII